MYLLLGTLIWNEILILNFETIKRRIESFQFKNYFVFNIYTLLMYRRQHLDKFSKFFSHPSISFD